MVRICTGEVWVRSSRRSRAGLLLLAGDEQRVLRVARRMVRRKVERLEIVVVGLDLGPFADGVAHRLEDGDDLVHHAQHGMLHADGALDAGERDVETLGGEFGVARGRVKVAVRTFDGRLDTCFELIDSLADITLCRAGRGL